MIDKKFIDEAKRIVAAHRAEYKGEYYMKGGLFGNPIKAIKGVFKDPLNALGSTLDNPIVNAAESFIPGVGPLVAAGSNTAGELLQGKSVGKSLESGALTGATSFAGQEIGGALANEFPGTAADLGLDASGNSLTDLLGTTTGAGSSLSSTLGGTPVGDALGISSNTLAPVSGEGISTPSVASAVAPAAGGVVSPSSVGSSDQAAIDAALQPDKIANNLGIGSVGSTGDTTQAAQALAPGAGPTQAAANALAPAAAPASSFLSKIEGGLGSSIGSSILPGAALAYQASQGPAKLPAASQALQPGGAATAPLLGLETSAANEATTGQLTAPQQAQVLEYVNGRQNELIQQLASSGVTNPTQDSRYISGLAKIQQDALAMQQQFITQAIQTATQAGGAASQNIANVATQQIQQDTAYQDALAQAFAALGGSAGAGAKAA